MSISVVEKFRRFPYRYCFDLEDTEILWQLEWFFIPRS